MVLIFVANVGTYTVPYMDAMGTHMGVSKNRGGPPKSSILIGFSIIFTIHFGVSLFLETPI